MPDKSQLGSFERWRRSLYRRLKYMITRPSPPREDVPFGRPVVVVGSAPVSHKPVGFDETYAVISINGSQVVSAKWGVDAPDVTIMQPRHVQGDKTNPVEVRRVLNGLRTKKLFVLLWRREREELERAVKAFNYGYDRLETIGRYSRIALIDKVSGIRTFEIDADAKYSNGVIGVLYALYNGATAVIITGINPDSSGHIYNQVGLRRLHVQMDRDMMLRLIAMGYPIYTADPDVAEAMGMPLWTGEASVRTAPRSLTSRAGEPT